MKIMIVCLDHNYQVYSIGFSIGPILPFQAHNNEMSTSNKRQDSETQYAYLSNSHPLHCTTRYPRVSNLELQVGML